MLTKRLMKELPYLLLATFIAFFLSTHLPNLELDVDPSYILFGAARPPLYPTFIWLFNWAGAYQFYIIMWLQGVFLFATLLYTRYWLRKHLQVSDVLIFLISFIVILTISFHFQLWFIQSEGLSFPLFIFAFFALIDSFKEFNLVKLTKISLLVSCLVLTRLQFYYFYILFVVLCLWYVWQQIPAKKLFYGMVILFSSVFITLLINNSYHYFKHGTFSGTSYGGLMLLVQTMYLANDNAASYFDNPTQKAYVQSMLDTRNAKHLNQDAELVATMKPSYLQHAYQSYARNYLAIQDIIDNILKTSVEKSTDAQNNIKANTIALQIDKIILQHEFKKNVIFLFWKFVQCMGGVPLLLFFLILMLTIPFHILFYRIRNPDISLIFIGVVTMITLLNAAMIAACNPDLPVYFCYSQFMLYCLAGLLVSKVFVKRIVNGKSSFN